MRTIRLGFLALAIAVLGGIFAQSAAADEAAVLYDPGTVFFIDLTLSPTEKAKLEATPDEYVQGTFSVTKSSDGTPAGEEATPFISERPVEVRLKGSVGGSFRELSGKAAFKLKFKKADAVLGLRKMTLNNMVQDPSMIHETLAYAAFGAGGVPASRTGYAYVRLNGEDFGLYLDLENLDDIALAKLFSSFDDEVQHLYEGEQGDDVFPGGATGFEVDEGPEDDIGDLEALVDATNEGGAPFATRLGPHANLAEMTRMWAVEKYIDHWDGYAGHTDQAQAEAGERPNNYYLFSEPSGRFQMLPWGADQTWIPTIDVGLPGREVTFDGSGGILFNKCLDDEGCFRAYWEALRDVTEAIADMGPEQLAEGTVDLLAPWQQEENDNSSREEYTLEEIQEGRFGVEETLEFIAGRRAEAEEWLAENEPPPIVVPVNSPQGSSGQSAAEAPPAPALLFAGSARSGRQLTARVRVSGAGFVSLRTTVKTQKGQRQVCRGAKQVSAAGEIALHCKLSKAAMKALDNRALRLKLTFTVTLINGRTETVLGFKRLPRR